MHWRIVTYWFIALLVLSLKVFFLWRIPQNTSYSLWTRVIDYILCRKRFSRLRIRPKLPDMITFCLQATVLNYWYLLSCQCEYAKQVTYSNCNSLLSKHIVHNSPFETLQITCVTVDSLEVTLLRCETSRSPIESHLLCRHIISWITFTRNWL